MHVMYRFIFDGSIMIIIVMVMMMMMMMLVAVVVVVVELVREILYTFSVPRVQEPGARVAIPWPTHQQRVEKKMI